MSSSYVREQIFQFITDNIPEESAIDLTADYRSISDLVASYSLRPIDPWLGVQFVGADEVPVDILATNTKGMYRETGVIFLHIVGKSSLRIHTSLLARAEKIRDTFRGQRVADLIVIEAVSPPNFGDGVTLNFEGGYTAALVQIDYHYDKVL